MTTRSRPTPIRLLVGLAAALALVLGLPAAPAGAHEGKAVLTIEAAHPAGMSVHYIVRVTWEDDGHPAADATVTATAVGPDGAQLTPVTLAPADADGRYAGVIDYPSPGAWTVRITSIDPTGSIEQSQEVVAATATAEDDAADDAAAADEGGFAPADDGTGASSGQAADDSSDDSGMPVVLIVVAAAVVVIGAVTAVNIIRRTRTGGGPGTGGGARGPTARDGAGAGAAPDGAAAGDGAEAEAGTGH